MVVRQSRSELLYHCYADDTQLYTALTLLSLSCIAHLKDCFKDLQYQFWQNNLLLNPDKSEVIYLGIRQTLSNSTRSMGAMSSHQILVTIDSILHYTVDMLGCC